MLFAGGFEIKTSTQSDWGAGFCQKISITNPTNVQASWTQASFVLKNAQISNFWNANFQSSDGTYTITPVSWNTTVWANQTIDIGYCAVGSWRPTNISINGWNTDSQTGTTLITRSVPVDISGRGMQLQASVQSDWNTGYCRSIVLKNTLKTPINNWKFSFDTPDVVSLWSGKLTKNNQNYVVTPESWNGTIESGKQAELGFCVTGTHADSNWQILQSDVIVPPKDPTPINGVCGSDNTKTLSTAPTNLCATGTASVVSGNGPWTWICQWQYQGTSMSCRSEKEAIIVMPPPSGSTINYTVDITKNKHTISPYIYWRNFGTGNDENFGAIRLGGNRLTGYNWENNASNAGTDWNNSSDGYLSNSNIPGKVVTDFHNTNVGLGVPYSLVTLPMAGYVARDKNGSVWTNETAPSSRFDENIFVKNAPFSLTPNLTDGKVYSDEFVNFLVKKYGTASMSWAVKGYALDNEPGLWATTHPRLHPNKATVNELITKSIALSKAIKSIDASAEVFWAVTYGFGENHNLQDAPDWSNYSSAYQSYIQAFLDKLRLASIAKGTRLLDVLDIHWYPEAQWTSIQGNKVRITEDNTDPDVARVRMQSPRSLWDSTYREDSWIGQWFYDEAFPVIPKLQASIAKYYPGTKLAFTEFNYGAPNHVSGGIATADVLGIYGKYNVYFATYWGDIIGYVSSAYKLYRNPDGAKKVVFGDISVDATNSDIVNTSIYASTESNSNRTHIILINKKTTSIQAHVNLIGVTTNTSEVYGFTSTTPAIQKMSGVTFVSGGFDYVVPALSVIHIVLTQSTVWPIINTTTSTTLQITPNEATSKVVPKKKNIPKKKVITNKTK